MIFSVAEEKGKDTNLNIYFANTCQEIERLSFVSNFQPVLFLGWYMLYWCRTNRDLLRC